MDIRLDYEPQPRQALLHNTTANQILYGGQAGGGKSHALRWDAIDFCINCPGLNAVLFRRTMPQLERNHVAEIRKLPKALGEYNETKKVFNFINGSSIVFKHLEHENDVDDIQGWEIHWAGVDEAGQCTEYQLEYIKSRIRIPDSLKEKWRGLGKSPYVDRLPRLALSANPGGVSHHYLKERYIDPAPPEELFCDHFTRDEEDPDDKGAVTVFIPSTLADNKYLGKEYRRQFSGLPEWQKKMLRDGDWDVVAGAYFDCWAEFSRNNIIKPFSIPDYWTKFRALDWGFATPFDVLWLAVSDGSPIDTKHGEVSFPKDALIVYREWYGSEKGNKGLRMPAENVAKGILERESEKVKYGVADPAMWRTDSGPSAAEKMRREGVIFGRADNQREAGWLELYTRMVNDGLYIFDTCRALLRTLPALERDDRNMEDVKKGGEDHPADTLRYGVMSRPFRAKKPEKPKKMDTRIYLPPVPVRSEKRHERI